MKRMSLTFFFITSALIAGTVYGQMVHKQIKMMKGPGCGMAENLTEEQQTKFDALHMDLDKALTSLKADLAIKKAELNKLMIVDNPNVGAVEKKIDEIYTLKSTIEKKKTKTHLDVRAILTPEQRVSFDKRHCCDGGPQMQMMDMMKSCGQGKGDCSQPCKKKIIINKLDDDAQEIDDMDVDVKVITE